jgi:hypothetical protein
MVATVHPRWEYKSSGFIPTNWRYYVFIPLFLITKKERDVYIEAVVKEGETWNSKVCWKFCEACLYCVNIQIFTYFFNFAALQMCEGMFCIWHCSHN